MPSAVRFLLTESEQLPSFPPSESVPISTDVVVVIAALVCAVVSVAGLALVARCACLRRSPALPANRGLEKEALQALPKISYDAGGGGWWSGPICLAEFEEGDELRMLPQCGHGFHVRCVDAWLHSHSSCPSCRRVLVVAAPPSR